MIRSIILAAAVLVLAGCPHRDDESQAASDFSCPDASNTLSFSVTPGTIVRSDGQTLILDWVVRRAVSNPALTMLLGDTGEVELVIPMLPVNGAPELTYHAELIQPFGQGTPVGTIRILATGEIPKGCPPQGGASATLVLE